jgi:hypothetical protein
MGHADHGGLPAHASTPEPRLEGWRALRLAVVLALGAGMNGAERVFVGVALTGLGLLASLALMTLLGV